MEDNRLFKRFKKNNLIKLCANEKDFFGNLDDISMMGCSVTTETKLELNQEIFIESYFFTSKLPAQVLRLNQDNESNKYGLVFKELSENSVKEIYNLLTIQEKD